MNKPLVFTDYHHVSLLKSLILLFEKRLGGAVYRPIGLEWANEGFWKIFDAEDTRQQFLSLDQAYKPVDGSAQLNQILETGDMYYQCADPEMPGEFNKAITLEQFKKLPIDIVVASIPEHIEPFKQLIQQYKPDAKLIAQVGNSWTFAEIPTENIMSSALMGNVPQEKNFVLYHQEFDTNIFRPENWIFKGIESPLITTPKQTIYSFINILQNTPDFPIFQQLEQRFTGWTFKSYGGQCRDGAITGSANLAHEIRKARFVYHLKPGGDGYGHVLHNALACGRPVIYNAASYKDKLGEKVLIDGVTGINVEGLSIDGIVDKINHFNEEARYRDLCRSTYKTFAEVVNFKEEEMDIRVFLDRLI